jgi:hypothetical protein
MLDCKVANYYRSDCVSGVEPDGFGRWPGNANPRGDSNAAACQYREAVNRANINAMTDLARYARRPAIFTTPRKSDASVQTQMDHQSSRGLLEYIRARVTQLGDPYPMTRRHRCVSGSSRRPRITTPQQRSNR